MTEKQIIEKVKSRIKILSDKQMIEKALLGKDHGKCPRSVKDLMILVNGRRVEIKALLNFYLELKKKNYRYNVKLADRYHYEEAVKYIADNYVVEDLAVA